MVYCVKNLNTDQPKYQSMFQVEHALCRLILSFFKSNLYYNPYSYLSGSFIMNPIGTKLIMKRRHVMLNIIQILRKPLIETFYSIM